MKSEVISLIRKFRINKRSSNYNGMVLELKEERSTGFCLWVPDRTGFIFLKKDQCIEVIEETNYWEGH